MLWLARIEGIDEKQYNKGLQYCNKILRIDSENALAYLYRGIIREQQNKVKLAIYDYNASLNSENIAYMGHYQLGQLYLRKGIIKKGRQELLHALRYAQDSDSKNQIKELIQEYEN